MHKIILKFRFIPFYFIVFGLLLAATNLNAQLVTNGSFENTEPGSYSDSLTGISGWVLELADGAEAEFDVVTDNPQHGNNALKVLPTTLGTNQWSVQVVADSIPAIPGDTYIFTCWARAETAGAEINITIGNYDYSEYGALRPVDLTTEWQQFTLEYTITDNETFIRAPFHFNYDTALNNAVYLDNVVIKNAAAAEEAMKPVIVEAESGEVGSDFSILEEDGTEYVTIQTNSTSYNPDSSARVITYEVAFVDTGHYDLFVRLRVGPGGFDDDSFFYGNGFGEQDPTVDSLWIFMNGMAAAGFSEPDEIVREAGGLGSEVWKWVNVSRNAYQGAVTHTFVVGDELTQTFQIAAREDGLDIDKIAFGKSSLYFTVGNLDNGEAGSDEPGGGDAWTGPPLATNQPKFVGNIWSTAQESNFESYWNQVTPENASKWGSVEGTRDNMNWNGVDAAYSLAKDNGFPFHFHVLIWGAQQPGWISNLESTEQLAEIREWFEAVAERYPDIDFLEVVNEPLPGHNPPDGNSGRANYKEALGGNGESGWDWVLNAFRMAREIFPEGTRLMLNDFNIISSSTATAQYLSLIRLLKSENLIDIIGVQGHAFSTTAPAVTMRRNLDSLSTVGIPIQVTELDIDGATDAVQLQSYQRIFPALYEHPKVEGITLWGWRRGLWRDDQGAFILNQDGTERPALVWLRDYLDSLNVDPVSVKDFAESPDEFRLDNNYPNPFNPATTIEYTIPSNHGVSTGSQQSVKLTVFDILGREIAVLVNKNQNPGKYKVTFDASSVNGLIPSGMYLYRLETQNYNETKKMILLK